MSFSAGFNNTFRTLDNARQWRSGQEENARQFDETLDETKRVNDSRIRNFQALTAASKELTKGAALENRFDEDTYDTRIAQEEATTRNKVAIADNNEAVSRTNLVGAEVAERTKEQTVAADKAKLNAQKSLAELETLVQNSEKAGVFYARIDNDLKGKSPQQMVEYLSDPSNLETLQKSVFLASLGEDVTGGGFGAEDGATLLPDVDDNGRVVGLYGVRVGPQDVSKTQKTDEEGNPVFAVYENGEPVLDQEGNPVPEDDYISIEDFAAEFQPFIHRQASLADGVGKGGQRRDGIRALGGGTQAEGQVPQPQGLQATEPGVTPAPKPQTSKRQQATEPGVTPAPKPQTSKRQLSALVESLEEDLAVLEKEIAEEGVIPEDEGQGTFLGRAGQIQEEHNARVSKRGRNATSLGQGFGAGAANTWDAIGTIGNHAWNGVRSLAGEVVDGMAGDPGPRRVGTPAQEEERAGIMREAEQLRAEIRSQEQQSQQPEQRQQPSSQRQQTRALGQPAPPAGEAFLAKVENMEEAMGRPMTGVELENFKFTGSIQVSPEKLTENSAKRTEAAQKQLTGFLKEVGTIATTSFGTDNKGRPGSVDSKAAGQAVQLQMEGLLNTNPAFRQIYNTPGGTTYLKVMANQASQRAAASGATPNLAAEMTNGISGVSARDAGKVLAHVIPQVSEDREIDDATYTRMVQAVDKVIQSRDSTAPITADEAEALAGKAMRNLRQ